MNTNREAPALHRRWACSQQPAVRPLTEAAHHATGAHCFLQATRIGTTQSAVARLESGKGKHSPSLATLQKYAHALGYRLELRLINDAIKTSGLTKYATGRAKKLRAV